MKREVLGFLFLSLALVFTGGCVEPATPIIKSISPASGAANVSIHAVVAISFSEKMEASSFEQGGFKLVAAVSQNTVPGSLAVSGEQVTFTPDASLEPTTAYQIKLAASVASEDGGKLGQARVFNFVTRAALGSGAVTFVEPADFVAGRAEVTLSNLSATENVLVIPVHATQAVTRGFSTDGFDYTIYSTGVLSLGATSFKTAPLASAQTTVTREFRRHPKNFKRYWEALKKLSPDEKRNANLRRASAPASFGKCAAPYTLGQQCTFKVIDYNDTFVNVTTTLKHVSGEAYFFVDNNDLADYADAELAQLGSSLDTVSIPSNRRHFGELPDTDGNGKVIVVLTRELIDPVAKTGAFGYVAPWDLYPDGTISQPSNEGDIFYAASAARVQALGYTRQDYLAEVMPETMVHELKHLVAIGGRLLNDLDTEDLWLEEPSAIAAEELAGFGTGTGGTQSMARYALAHPENYRLEWDGRPTDLDEEYSMYGFNFLFLWRVAEARGHDPFWKEWIAGPGTGIANLEAHAGVSFRSLMTDWAVTLGFDHQGRIPDFDYDSINLRDGSWSKLGIKPLDAAVTGSVRSAAYYLGGGLGTSATIRLESSYLSPYFVVVRFPK